MARPCHFQEAGMKAIVYDRYGPAEVLKLVELERPNPGDEDVLVRVHAAAATRADCHMRRAEPFIARFFFGLLRPRKPIIPGAELAGEVVAVGKQVTGFAAGDRVWGSTGESLGAVAEYARVRQAGALAPMPAGLRFEEATAILEGGLTALTFLGRVARLQPGQRLMVIGASGAVGSAAVQIGKRHLGARVTGVCSGANVELVRSLGADEVIDYQRDRLDARGDGYDVVFDTVGKSSFAEARALLSPRGIYLSPVLGMKILLQTAWTKGFGRKKAIIAFAGLERDANKLEDMKLLAELVAAGKLRAVIDRRYPLAQAVEAYRYVEAGHKKGNVIIAPSAEAGGA
jgi:NADPH:quinone reductase-like Zn-dependent oxidoreductase